MDQRLENNPDDLDARLVRALANFRLGADQKAFEDLQVVIGKDPEAVSARRYRAISLARLGRKPDALAELAKFPKGKDSERTKLSLAVVVAAEMGEGVDTAVESLGTALGKPPKDADLRYEAARAFALASRAIARSDPAKGHKLAERSLRLLRESVRDEDADFGQMDQDPDLDPIRDDPPFAEIMKAGHPDRRYAAVWSGDARFEAAAIDGLDPVEHLRRGRELMGQGYRPVAWSVARTAPEGPLVTASVWHRPVVGEPAKDGLAERQARAAVALVRLGHAEQVWPLLRHSADPRLRSFLVNWLEPLGADPHAIMAELARLDSSPRPAERGEGGRRPGEGSAAPATAMDAILFHPETSMRRALILALGKSGSEGLSPGEREPLAAKLLDLYRNDPDAGIHGAAEWTLRRWGQQAKLEEIDARLRGKPKGDRRWYVNRQGQTFVLIEGPVEFRMGSPPHEPDRYDNERPHRRVIPRRFAIAAKEVTVEQYQRFAQGHPQSSIALTDLDRFSPEPNGPMIAMSWFDAAAYCNWLSKEDGLPKDQWCYLPNERGEYDRGMVVPADVLRRTGYRLPTEPEWEYACRAGAMTSRYYGASLRLLEHYAWTVANAQDRTWPCGRLLPNDLGLFDMLGNVYE
jgi:formylglycine-generating enzyme required for sulfatase activity